MIENLSQNITQTSSTTSSNDSTTISIEQNKDQSQIDYRMRYQAAEAKCRHLEEKLHQLETQTIKELQTKIEKLERNVQRAQVCDNRLI